MHGGTQELEARLDPIHALKKLTDLFLRLEKCAVTNASYNMVEEMKW